MLQITLKSGLIGKMESQRKVIRALGLRKYGTSVIHQDSPVIRGMINKVSHMLEVKPHNEVKGSKKISQKRQKPSSVKK